MTLWLVRAGSRSELEQKFLDEGRTYMVWVGLNVDPTSLPMDSLSCRSHLSY